MSAPDASLLRRASPGYRRAVSASATPTGCGVGVAGYAAGDLQRHPACPTIPVRLLLVTGEAIDVRLPVAIARSLAADLLQRVPPFSAHTSEATKVDIAAGNGP
jgi:hypothetical protein